MITCDLLFAISKESLDQFGIAYYQLPHTAHKGNLTKGISYEVRASPVFTFNPTDPAAPVMGHAAEVVQFTLHYPMVDFQTPVGGETAALLMNGEVKVDAAGALGLAVTGGKSSMSGELEKLAEKWLVPEVVKLANGMLSGISYNNKAVAGIELSAARLYATRQHLAVLYNVKSLDEQPGIPLWMDVPRDQLVVMLSDYLQDQVMTNMLIEKDLSFFSLSNPSAPKPNLKAPKPSKDPRKKPQLKTIKGKDGPVQVSTTVSLHKDSGAKVTTTTNDNGTTVEFHDVEFSITQKVVYTWDTISLADGAPGTNQGQSHFTGVGDDAPIQKHNPPGVIPVKGPPPVKGPSTHAHHKTVELQPVVVPLQVVGHTSLYLTKEGSYGADRIRIKKVEIPTLNPNIPELPDWAQSFGDKTNSLLKTTADQALTHAANAYLGTDYSYPIAQVGTTYQLGHGLQMNLNGFKGGYVNGFYGIQFKTGVGSSHLFVTAGGYVQVPESSRLGTASFTVETWVMCGPQGQKRAWILSRPHGQNLQYGFLINEGRPAFQFGMTTGHQQSIEGANMIADNQWHHLAATYDEHKQVLKFFVDGSEVESRPHTGAIVRGNDGLFMGRFNVESKEVFSGYLRETRIWNSVQNGDQLKNLMGSTLFGNIPGLVAYYTYDPMDLQTVRDQTGHGNNGSCKGTALQESNADGYGIKYYLSHVSNSNSPYNVGAGGGLGLGWLSI